MGQRLKNRARLCEVTAKDEANALIDLIIERAPALRAAGVLQINLGGSSFVLSPAQPEPDDGQQDDDPIPDALHDPATFGVVAPNAKALPRRTRTPL